MLDTGGVGIAYEVFNHPKKFTELPNKLQDQLIEAANETMRQLHGIENAVQKKGVDKIIKGK